MVHCFYYVYVYMYMCSITYIRFQISIIVIHHTFEVFRKLLMINSCGMECRHIQPYSGVHVVYCSKQYMLLFYVYDMCWERKKMLFFSFFWFDALAYMCLLVSGNQGNNGLSPLQGTWYWINGSRATTWFWSRDCPVMRPLLYHWLI